MKKYINIITLATLALLAATGCQKELTDGNDGSRINSDEIGFSINQSNYWNNNGSGSQTKSTYLGDMELTNETGESINVSMTMLDGIESLPDPMSETKGAMITGTTLKSYNIGVNAFLNGTTSKYIDDQIMSVDTPTHVYQPTGSETSNHWAPVEGHTYYWPKANPLDFWAWAPLRNDNTPKETITLTDAIVNGESKTKIDQVAVTGFGFKDNKLEFTYDLGKGTDAVDMPDLMFANVNNLTQDNIKEKTGHDTGCVPLAFQHALAAVQFKVIANKKYQVKSISLVDVTSTDNCSFSESAFTWAGSINYGDYSHTFEEDLAYQQGTSYGNQYYKDLSGSDQIATFMMIPQTLRTSSGSRPQKINIVLSIGEKDYSYTGVINSGATTTQASWQAGKTYVYTIAIDEVNVIITDEVTSTLKNNVIIKNTGTAKAYLRAAIVGYWANNNERAVAPWNPATDGCWNGATTAGPLPLSGWVYNDGYYYYPYPVLPGQEPGADSESGVQKLFASYKPGTAPLNGAHLVMDIAVQAIPVGTYSSYTAAWSAVLPTTTE